MHEWELMLFPYIYFRFFLNIYFKTPLNIQVNLHVFYETIVFFCDRKTLRILIAKSTIENNMCSRDVWRLRALYPNCSMQDGFFFSLVSPRKIMMDRQILQKVGVRRSGSLILSLIIGWWITSFFFFFSRILEPKDG